MTAIICDLDGTLALMGSRNPYDASTCENDKLNQPVANLLDLYKQNLGYDILLVSGRSDKYREETKRWLAFYAIPYDALIMRPDGDFRPDEELKQEFYDTKIAPYYDIHLVLDDRSKVVKMWRKNKLTCLQVAFGDF